ncbi:MAG TPA: septal ring lytic transglycosylase RlpA family protein [Nevskiaceae bacterium]|nr:septal ring lytic transglycosylase RlpA family protein [Nevskiaceae bacterium]
MRSGNLRGASVSACARWVGLLALSATLVACSNVAYRYRVDGHTYAVLRNANHYDHTGVASWYGPAYQGRPTASGQIYNMYEMTAASKVLPIYSYVRVTDLETGASEVVLINDRGPFYPGRIIDLSYEAAHALGMAEQGTARVRVEVLPHYRVPKAPIVASPALAVVATASAITTQPAPSPVASNAPERLAANQQATEPAPATLPQPSHGQYMQAGLFTIPGDAQRLRDRLEAAGIADIELRAALYDGRPATLVVVGPFTQASALQHAKTQLATLGIQSIPYRS